MHLTAKKIIALLLVLAQFHGAYAQEKVSFKMRDEVKNMELVHARAERAIILLNEKAFLNETQIERLKANFISLDNLLLFKLRDKNTELEHVLLSELIQIKSMRLDMLQRMLTEYQFAEYNKYQQSIEKAQYEKLKLNEQLDDPMFQMRSEALGWDLLQDDIRFQ